MSRAALVSLLVACAIAPARADRADYVGSAACGACHPKELAAWQATAHARASATLGADTSAPSGSVTRGGAVPRRCYACHGTGDAPAGAAYWPEVGCEACHGAGAAYAPDDVMRDLPLAQKLGLRDVTTPAARSSVCAGCHRGPGTRLAPLDLAALVHPDRGAKP